MTILTLVGLLASVVVGLKNSAGQSLVGTTAANIITSAEGVVTSIIADIQAAGTSGATSQTAITAYLQTIQVLLTALQSDKVLSAQTVSQTNALSTALAAALAAEETALKTTDPSTLTPIPAAV